MKNKGLYCRYSVYYYEEEGQQIDAVLGSETYEEENYPTFQFLDPINNISDDKNSYSLNFKIIETLWDL